MTLFIYKAEGFDEGNYELFDEIEGIDNSECESKAEELYDDPDEWCWSYTKA